MAKKPRETVFIHIAGCCEDGVGGWAVIIQNANGSGQMRIIGGTMETTRNRMEMVAAIQAIKFCRKWQLRGRIQSDSEYVTKGYNIYMNNWQKGPRNNGLGDWKKADGKPVQNDDLWKELHGLRREFGEHIAILISSADRAENDLDRLADANAMIAAARVREKGHGFTERVGQPKSKTGATSNPAPAPEQADVIPASATPDLATPPPINPDAGFTAFSILSRAYKAGGIGEAEFFAALKQSQRDIFGQG